MRDPNTPTTTNTALVDEMRARAVLATSEARPEWTCLCPPGSGSINHPEIPHCSNCNTSRPGLGLIPGEDRPPKPGQLACDVCGGAAKMMHVRCAQHALVSEAARPDPARSWGYSSSRDAEVWSGACATRDEAIAEGVEELGEDSDVWIVSGHPPDPADWCPDVVEWLDEAVAQNAYDNAGDIAENWPDQPVSKEAHAELQQFCEAWVRRNMPVNFWIADGGDHEQVHTATLSVSADKST